MFEMYTNFYDFSPWISYDCRPFSVLIVEDDALMQAQFTSLVRTLDFDDIAVDRVATAEEAKRLLSKGIFEPYDLIISDHYLLGKDTGLELWIFCREKHPETKFILTSGTQIQKVLERFGQTMGEPSFLEKPFSIKQALTKIRDLVEGRPTQP